MEAEFDVSTGFWDKDMPAEPWERSNAFYERLGFPPVAFDREGDSVSLAMSSLQLRDKGGGVISSFEEYCKREHDYLVTGILEDRPVYAEIMAVAKKYQEHCLAKYGCRFPWKMTRKARTARLDALAEKSRRERSWPARKAKAAEKAALKKADSAKDPRGLDRFGSRKLSLVEAAEVFCALRFLGGYNSADETDENKEYAMDLLEQLGLDEDYEELLAFDWVRCALGDPEVWKPRPGRIASLYTILGGKSFAHIYY